jgi:ribosomal protein S18 acetylase RimI-like enzyme
LTCKLPAYSWFFLMAISTAISRFSDYSRRHGLRATVGRISVALSRSILSGRSVLFYCDLATQVSPPRNPPTFLRVVRRKNLDELEHDDLEAMMKVWNPQLIRQTMKKRFDLGASLWLIKSHGELAGYGWTLQGRTVEPHYFPLGNKDVQFLDFHVFPGYRGRAIDWFLMTQILHRLAMEGLGRAFGEAAEWNKASIASFSMTPFQRLGMARKWRILGHTFVRWAKNGKAPGSTKVP